MTHPDPGVRKSINLKGTRVVYREATLSSRRIDDVRPFDQALSDRSSQPIRAVIAEDGTAYIMQGNHRVFAATLDGVEFVEGLLYTPQQWQSFTGTDFKGWGAGAPPIR